MSTEEAAPNANMAGDAPPEEAAPPEKVVKEVRAIVLSGFGGVKMLKTVKKPEICAGDGELKIRVKAWYVYKVMFSNIWSATAYS